jgi:hypothetical protein
VLWVAVSVGAGLLEEGGGEVGGDPVGEGLVLGEESVGEGLELGEELLVGDGEGLCTAVDGSGRDTNVPSPPSEGAGEWPCARPCRCDAARPPVVCGVAGWSFAVSAAMPPAVAAMITATAAAALISPRRDRRGGGDGGGMAPVIGAVEIRP